MVYRKALDNCPHELGLLEEQLQKSQTYFDEHIDAVAAELTAESQLPCETLVDYWRTIDYHLGDKHLRSLKLFFRLCKKNQLLDEEPELNFLNI